MTRTNTLTRKKNGMANSKHQQAEVEFAKLIENVSVRGFHGSASVTVNVQDGHIQTTRVMVDRMIRESR